MHLVYTPKLSRTIVSNFSWVLQSSQEKSREKVMRNFGGKQNALQSNVKMVNIPWFIRLLADRLFTQNPSSSYLMQRDCKPRCYYLGIETRREKTGLRPRFSRQAPSPLACSGFACSNFAKKNKRDCSQSMIYRRPGQYSVCLYDEEK